MHPWSQFYVLHTLSSFTTLWLISEQSSELTGCLWETDGWYMMHATGGRQPTKGHWIGGSKTPTCTMKHSQGGLEQSPAAASVGVSYTQLQNVIKLTHTSHPLAREDIFAHSGQMTQFVFYTTTGMETGAPSHLVNMVTSARNVGAGIQSLAAQSKSGHILPPNKDQEGRTDSP